MSQSWFYLVGDQALGPLSLEELRAAASAGLVKHDTRVRPDASDTWSLACEVGGLLLTPPPVQGTTADGTTAAAVVPPPRSPVAPPIVAPPVAGQPVVGQPVEPKLAAPPANPPSDQATRFPFGLVIGLLSGLVLCLVLAMATGLLRRSTHSPDAQGVAETAEPPARPDKQFARMATSTPGDAATQPTGQSEVQPPPAEVAQTTAGSPSPAKKEPPAGELAVKPAPIQLASNTLPRRPAWTPFESRADRIPPNRIDELVSAKWKQLGIQPAGLCSEAVFVRRVYLDVIGTLPTADEARQFLLDTDRNKRRDLIERLLAREEFADYWAMKWSDLLRVKAEFPINLWPNAAQVYHRWIRTCLKQNLPYDQFVREMLTASGSNFRVPQVNFYRALQSRQPQAIAQTVALTFMATRAENWPKERLAGMAGFFSQVGYKSTAEWKEEIVLFDPRKAAAHTAGSPSPRAIFPDGTPAILAPDQDPREVFANWLIDTKNPWFARAIVNRVWSWLLGRGIIHEPDDIRPDNPAQNPELLDWLAGELVSARYDLKHVYREILNSRTYQLSSLPKGDSAQSAAHFAHYALRRLEAEVLIDAFCQITGTTEKYTSAIPEPFTFIPEDLRSIALPDGSITSSFLEMFGRPPRDTGLEAERNNKITAAQQLHLLNSTHIRQKFEQGPKFQALLRTTGRPRDAADHLYLTIVSRFPTDAELAAVRAYSESGAKGWSVMRDVAWALVNSVEFLYRH